MKLIRKIYESDRALHTMQGLVIGFAIIFIISNIRGSQVSKKTRVDKKNDFDKHVDETIAMVNGRQGS